MIVDHAGGLHVGVANGGPHEAEAPFAQILAHGIGFRRNGGNLREWVPAIIVIEWHGTLKYVSKQYLDNSSNADRMLNAYFVNNIRFNYSIKVKHMKRIDLALTVNNIFNEMYSSNGYTYAYYTPGNTLVNQNNLFPQAGTNFLLGLTLKF